MERRLDDAAFDVLFRRARTHRDWQNKPVPNEMFAQLYDLVRWAPTTNNTCPARFIFVISTEGKERLKPHLTQGNVAATMAAPATAIIGYALDFFELMPKLSPNPGARDSWRRRSAADLQEAAFRNGSMQAGYFILAARAVGLDCGPMSGFDNAGVDREFFAGTATRSNILCNLGYGEESELRARSGRLEFDDACRFV